MTAATPTNAAADWSQLYQYRRAVQRRYKSIWRVPVKKRPQQLVIERLASIDSVLELGAGDGKLGDQLRRHKSTLDYKSFDIDRSHQHDFYQLDEIEGSYDATCMFEVIEHVTPATAYTLLSKAYEHLAPGGLMFVTTPNTYNPPEYLRDCTHITPWCYDELGAVIQLAGFELDSVYRLYQAPLLTKLWQAWLARPLFKTLGIDYAKQIIAVGRKP